MKVWEMTWPEFSRYVINRNFFESVNLDYWEKDHHTIVCRAILGDEKVPDKVLDELSAYS
jgi:hypothetical protein